MANLDIFFDDSDCDTCDLLTEWNVFNKKEIGNLTLIHLNIRSIKKHFDQFIAYVLDVLDSIDFLVLSEINLSNEDYDIYENTFNIEGFNRICRCRTTGRGGGLLVFYKECLDVTLVESNFTSCEHLCFELALSSHHKYKFLLIYRPPDKCKYIFIQELQQFIRTIEQENLIIVGDININTLNRNNVADLYMDTLYSLGFTSKINIPTREEIINENLTSTCIDHIFINEKICTSKGSVIRTKISDHYMVGLNVKTAEINTPSTAFVIKKTNSKILSEELSKRMNLEQLSKNKNVSDLYKDIVKLYNDSLKIATTTFTKLNSKRNQKPWVTKDIKNDMKLRDKLFSKWKKSNHGTEQSDRMRQEYKAIRNQIIKKISQSKKNYYSSLFSEHKNDIKKTWTIINQIIGKGKSQNLDNFTKHMKTDEHTIANSFVDVFTRKPTLSTHNCSGLLLPNNHQNTPQSIYIPNMDIEDIENVLQVLKKKSPGIDGINIKDILNNKNIFIPVLKLLFEMSFQEQKVPKDMKTAVVRPVYKKGPKIDYNNYRPISILPTFDKIIERYVSDKIISYLNKYDILDKNQYGFIKNKSTTNLLEYFSDIVNESLGNRMHVLCIFVDFTKAFDTIDHGKLLIVLRSIGIRGHLLGWIENYLNERFISVKVGNSYSKQIRTPRGVPQGSILGPLFYILYVNDIGRCFKDCKYLLYADDTIIFAIHQNLKIAEKYLQTEFRNFQQWVHDKDLVLNKAKTTLIHIRSPHVSYNHNPKIIVHTTDCLHKRNDESPCCKCAEEITIVRSQKYLGLYIDDHFLWDIHTKELANRLRPVLGKLYWLRHILPKNILKTIYISLFESIFSYGISIWGQASDYLINKVESLRQRAIKTICAGCNLCSSGNGVNCLNVLSVSQLHRSRLIINNFKSLENYDIVGHAYNTRHRLAGSLRNEMFTNKYGSRTLNVKLPRIFNSIPPNIRSTKKISTFKKELKSYMISQPTM